MRIDVRLFHQDLVEIDVREKQVVVVDIFRATSTIITAINNGAKEVVPFIKTEEVVKEAKHYSAEKVLKCGERKGMKFTGFDLGNSSLEYTRDKVIDKTLLFSSTNGSQVFLKVKSAREVMVGGFINVNKVAERIAKNKGDCIIYCAGNYGKMSLEDTVCAGMILAKLNKKGNRFEMDDEARMSIILYQYYLDDFQSIIRDSSHGRYLSSLGRLDDMKYCLKVNEVNCLPLYYNKSIVSSAAEE